jgi:urease accessory protein
LKPVRSIALAALALLAAGPALAHPGHAADTLAAGLMHPLTGLDHILAMAAVGLMAAQRGGNALWLWPVAFVAAMLAGYGVGAAQPSGLIFEPGVLASVIVLGALVAARTQVPLAMGASLIGVFGVCHGYVHGAESPTGAGLAFPIGFALATVGLHGAGIAAGLSARRTGRAQLVRLVGSGVAAAGVVLTLVG